MNKERIKLIINDIETLLETLKDELSFEDNPLVNYEYEDVVPHIDDYDEVFYEDD